MKEMEIKVDGLETLITIDGWVHWTRATYLQPAEADYEVTSVTFSETGEEIPDALYRANEEQILDALFGL